jgi:Ca-activated chloride channel homolog
VSFSLRFPALVPDNRPQTLLMQVETRPRAAIALVLACTSIVAAQEPAVFRASTDVVLVPLSVTDRNGRFVRGLTSEHFQISDGGTRRAVKQFSSERDPISLALLLDISGSLAQDPEARAADDARWADTRRAIELLLTRLGAEDEVLFAVFNEQAKASPWTQEHRSILGTFDLLYRGGDTALLEAVKQTVSVFHTARHRRKVLLLISDGNDMQIGAAGLPPPDAYEIGSIEQKVAGTNDWRRARRELVIEGSRNAVRRSDAVLYAVGIGTRRGVPVNTDLLDRLTKESGGYVEPVRSPSEIASAVARICDDLQSQYLLTFQPAHADGKYHPIRVRTKDTRLKVRTRAGYVSASGP